jgi:cytochrome c biogenesis protein CcmG, thiol:disulfide interchange protein DsbE
VIAVVAVVVVAGLAAAELFSGSASQGREAPTLPRTALAGRGVSLADLRGHPAAINFFASWCEPCRKEAPNLDALSRSLPQGDALVGVAWNDGRSSARDFVHHYGWQFPTLFDTNGTAGDKYGIQGLPTTFILDSDGRIDRVLRGPQDAADVRQALADAS